MSKTLNLLIKTALKGKTFYKQRLYTNRFKDKISRPPEEILLVLFKISLNIPLSPIFNCFLVISDVTKQSYVIPVYWKGSKNIH